MDMERFGSTVVKVTLSKRNLLTLLTKLDRPESERTINRATDGGFLIVTGESDAVHYKDREPGIMVDWTEDDIAASDHAIRMAKGFESASDWDSDPNRDYDDD